MQENTGVPVCAIIDSEWPRSCTCLSKPEQSCAPRAEHMTGRTPRCHINAPHSAVEPPRRLVARQRATRALPSIEHKHKHHTREEDSHGGERSDNRGPYIQAILHAPLCAGARRHRHRNPARAFLSAAWRADEAARRRLHQADQDDDRAHYLLHRRARHRQHGGHEEGRARRAQGADLLRSGRRRSRSSSGSSWSMSCSPAPA